MGGEDVDGIVMGLEQRPRVACMYKRWILYGGGGKS